jgi:hypothetical protein
MNPPIPPSWIDVVLVLQSPLHPPMTIILAVVVILIRRWAWLCGGLLALFGQHEVTPWALVLLPAAAAYLDEDMSSEEDEAAEPEPEPEPLGSPVLPHMNAVEPRSSGSSEPFVLALNADEMAAVARIIEHNKTAARPSKSSAIQAGFGVSRGGSQTYRRASAIYDALFGAPPPAVQYRQPDGGTAPPSYPVTGRAPTRTRAR